MIKSLNRWASGGLSLCLILANSGGSAWAQNSKSGPESAPVFPVRLTNAPDVINPTLGPSLSISGNTPSASFQTLAIAAPNLLSVSPLHFEEEARKRHPVMELISTLEKAGVNFADDHLAAQRLRQISHLLPDVGRDQVLTAAENLLQFFDGASDSSSLGAPAAKLRWTPDPGKIPASTKDMPLTAPRIVGQDDAIQSLEFGAEMPALGWNILVMGARGTGRFAAVKSVFEKAALKKSPAPDLIAVPDLNAPDGHPSHVVFMELPSGRSVAFKSAFAEFIGHLKKRLPNLTMENLLAPILRPIVAELSLPLRKTLDNSPDASEYIDALTEYLSNHASDFIPTHSPKQDPSQIYKATVLVDHSNSKGAPVVSEIFPTPERIAGYIKTARSMAGEEIPGGQTVIPGSLHDARGGFFIAEARELLRSAEAFDIVMKAAKYQLVESYERGMMRLLSHHEKSNEVGANIKFALIGSEMLFEILKRYDEDFADYFKVHAAFRPQFHASEPSSLEAYLHFFKQMTVEKPDSVGELSRGAMIALLEIGSVLADSNAKLTAQFSSLLTYMQEATFWSQKRREEAKAWKLADSHENHSPEVLQQDVERASAELYRRNGLQARTYLDNLKNNPLLETTGSKVEQINSLHVLFGSTVYGGPGRVTVTHSIGKSGVISVDHSDAQLTGSDFNKAIGIIRGWLNSKFAQNHPLSAAIQVVYEQSHGNIDGDSATLTETLAILSSLSGIGIQQRFAVTGSMDQFGNVQPIGGINYKIAGFFDVVKARGQLNQKNPPGIIMPALNAHSLALRPDIEQAVAQGLFKIEFVRTVEEAWQIISGTPFEEAQKKADETLDRLYRASLPHAEGPENRNKPKKENFLSRFRKNK